MIGHLGPRVSALLDGRLPVAEEERAWSHVDQCPSCRVEVQRHGWVKTRLAGLSFDGGPDTGALKTALLAAGPPPTGVQLLEMSTTRPAPRPRHRPALAALGTGAAGVVALGVLAVVAPPADAPVRQPPTARPADVGRSPGPVPVPIRLRDQP